MALIEDAAVRGQVEGLQVARGAPKVTHLFFVDDNLLFTKADLVSATTLRKVLKDYEMASGQVINFQKSSLCFNPNVCPTLIENIEATFGIEVVATHTR